MRERLGTSQQQISRLESPLYEGHSLSMLRRVAEVLGARVHIELQSGRKTKSVHVAEKQARYGAKKKITVHSFCNMRSEICNLKFLCAFCLCAFYLESRDTGHEPRFS